MANVLFTMRTPAATDRRNDLAARLWALDRRATRQRFLRRGMAVATWDGYAPLAETVSHLAVLRRRTRRSAG